MVKVILLLALVVSCTGNNESFKSALERNQSESLTLVPEVGEGAPFFAPGTLTPVWEKSGAVVSLSDFELVNHEGKPVSKSHFTGKVSIVSFIFTSCAGFCPALIKKMKRVAKSIGDKDVQFVAITVDPEVDTPEKLRDFAELHQIDGKKNWSLLTGKRDTIYHIARNTFASEVKDLSIDDMRKFAHSEHFYIIDQDLHLRGVLNGTRIDLPESASKITMQLRK